MWGLAFAVVGFFCAASAWGRETVDIVTREIPPDMQRYTILELPGVALKKHEKRIVAASYEVTSNIEGNIMQGAQVVCEGAGHTWRRVITTRNHEGTDAGNSVAGVHGVFEAPADGVYTFKLLGHAGKTTQDGNERLILTPNTARTYLRLGDFPMVDIEEWRVDVQSDVLNRDEQTLLFDETFSPREDMDRLSVQAGIELTTDNTVDPRYSTARVTIRAECDEYITPIMEAVTETIVHDVHHVKVHVGPMRIPVKLLPNASAADIRITVTVTHIGGAPLKIEGSRYSNIIVWSTAKLPR